MIKSLTISKEKPASVSLDYAALYREGLEWAQRFSGSIWTDYNIHDPGVTILEYLCFGITDVGYRCQFPITDLLYAKEGKQIKWADNAFFPLEDILPCAPLTKNDFRRLLLDHLLKDVKNVWVKSVNLNRDGYKGLYDIYVQLNEETIGNSNLEDDKLLAKNVTKKIRELFCENRNLCEDINEIHILKQETIEIEADFHIQADASSEQVLADIIHAVEHFIAPTPKLYRFEALREEGIPVDEILDGPVPMHGFTKTEDLQRFAQSLNVAQLKHHIASVPGILRMEKFSIKVSSVPQLAEDIPLPENTYFTLDRKILKPENHGIQLFRNGFEVKTNKAETEQILISYWVKEYQGFLHQLDLQQPITLSEKNLEAIAAYYSIQRFFPAVYGIGAYGLPRDSNSLRQAEARQLKGFLSIFEIMLAGYLKQLTQLRELFSTGKPAAPIRIEEPELESYKSRLDTPPIPPNEEPTYFAQFPFDIPDIEPLLGEEKEEYYDEVRQFHQEINNRLAAFTQKSDRSLDRRNEFADHLLARFGESFNSDLLNKFTNNTDDGDELKKSMLLAKRHILHKYDTLSRNRGMGFNYLLPNNPFSGGHTDDSEHPNISGLKKNICYRLNIPRCEDRSLTEYFPFKPFGFASKSTAGTYTKSSVSLRNLLRNGRNENNYQIEENSGRPRFTVFFKETAQKDNTTADNQSPVPKEKTAFEKKRLFDTDKNAEEELRKFLKCLKDFHENANGFFIVEHLLLRPSTISDLEGKAQNASSSPQTSVVAPTISDLKEKNAFFSHQISVVAPTWAGIFMARDARPIFEDLVLQLAPAHLRVSFHWFNWNKMKTFENDYKQWLEEKSAKQPNEQTLDQLASRLIKQLDVIKANTADPLAPPKKSRR